jgi:ABC-type multidrug transport system fused ATPase/permease subunit
VVGQEPVLFDLTIKENIKLGNFNATDADIEKAIKDANAFDFIQKFPKGLETMVGEGGTQMSGGQKQRIAIARALVRNPQILLLDEATSALDTESEKVVQDALDKARTGRTTLVVAHRLSTIRTADLIVAIEEGHVKEMGTHDELMANEGLYRSLITRQLEGKIILDNDQKDRLYPDLDEEASDTNKLERKDSIVGKLTRGISKRLSRRLSRGAKNTGEEKEAMEEDLPKIQVSRLLKRNKPEWMYIVIGGLASCFMAALMPVFAILFGDILGVLGYPDTAQARSESVYYTLLFLLLGTVAAVSELLKGWMFAISGEYLTKRLRRDAFAAMLAQEIGFYDRPENNTGALCARLSGDAGKVQGATGARVGALFHTFFSIIISVFIGVYYQWKLGLVASLFFPIMVGATYLQQKIINGVDTVETEAFQNSAKVRQINNYLWMFVTKFLFQLAIEAITNIRTVAGLRCEAKYVEMYIELLAAPHKLTLKKSHLRGFIFGFSQSIQFVAWAVIMWYGGYLVDQGETLFPAVFT